MARHVRLSLALFGLTVAKVSTTTINNAPSSIGIRTVRMKTRTRPIKDEQHGRIAHLHEKARSFRSKHGHHKHHHKSHSHSSLLNSNYSNATTDDNNDDFDAPDFESEAYYEYPLTLDYVVDLAFKNGTDGNIVEYPVIVDTGSSNLAIAVAACTSCDSGSTSLRLGWYDPELCIDVTYGSGSWDGLMTAKTQVGFIDGDETWMDDVYLGGIITSDSFFEGNFNGILGLAYSALSESYSTCTTSLMEKEMDVSLTKIQHGIQKKNADGGPSSQTTIESTPLIDSFYEDGLLSSQMFSILFCGDDAIMSVGGYDKSQILQDDVTFVETQKTYGMVYGYYLVEVLSISMDNETISDDSSMLNEIGGFLVDSGTTLIYLPSAVTTIIEDLVKDAIDGLDDRFFEWSECVSAPLLPNFPTLTIELNGHTLKLKGADYLLWYDDCYYWGIASSSIPIIGNVALQDTLVVFDKSTNTIGFAEGDCSSLEGDNYEDDETSFMDSLLASGAAYLPETVTNMRYTIPVAFVALSGAFIAFFRWRRPVAQYREIA